MLQSVSRPDLGVSLHDHIGLPPEFSSYELGLNFSNHKECHSFISAKQHSHRSKKLLDVTRPHLNTSPYHGFRRSTSRGLTAVEVIRALRSNARGTRPGQLNQYRFADLAPVTMLHIRSFLRT